MFVRIEHRRRGHARRLLGAGGLGPVPRLRPGRAGDRYGPAGGRRAVRSAGTSRSRGSGTTRNSELSRSVRPRPASEGYAPRLRRSTTDDEACCELDARRVERPAFHQQLQHLRRDAAHLGQRLPHRGQRRRCPPGHRQVVEADDAQVGRHGEAGDPRRLHDAERLLVAAGEDGPSAGQAARAARVLGRSRRGGGSRRTGSELRVVRRGRRRRELLGSRRCGPDCTAGAWARRSPRSDGAPARRGGGWPRGRRSSWSRPRWGCPGRGRPPGRSRRRGSRRGRKHVAAPVSART